MSKLIQSWHTDFMAFCVHVFMRTLSCVAYAFYIGDQLDKGEMSKLPLVENGPLEEIQMEKTV